MIKRVVLKIYGDVQGVFFRAFASEKAREFNLTGWVDNEPDSTVKVVAEGEEENLKKLIENCQEGPRFAKVEKVEVKWEEANGEFGGFVIR